MANPKALGPIDPRPLTRAVLLALGAYIAAEAAMVVISALEIGRLMNGPLEMSIGAEGATFVALLAYFPVYLVAAFLILKWIYRVNRNASALASDKSISPAWSVGWFFVPFANFVMPFRAISETWRISRSPMNWKQAVVPDRLSFWWGLWVLSSLLNAVGGYPDSADGDLGPLLLGRELSLLGSCIAIGAALLLRAIVREITEAQAAALGPTPQMGTEAPAAVSG